VTESGAGGAGARDPAAGGGPGAAGTPAVHVTAVAGASGGTGPGPAFRVGLGYDAHRFAPDRALVLGGVRLREQDGLLGHSDADVLVHAIMDALLGAAGLEDIGHYFPDTDPTFAGADSMGLLAAVVVLLRDRGWRPGNVDAVVICEEPRIAPHRARMRQRLAEALGIEPDAVGIRGTTTEGMGFTGRREGIAAQAVALVERTTDSGESPR
jgi:2-C-methyl-D-erythritol 2,4-cyclodiphosphate synthase